MIVTPFAQVGAVPVPRRGGDTALHPAPGWVSQGGPPGPSPLSPPRSWPASAPSGATWPISRTAPASS